MNSRLGILSSPTGCVSTKTKGLPLQEGVIATGDQFVANSERKIWIGETFNAAALEMEGAAVGVVCNALDIPFFILRAISDTADMDAGFDVLRRSLRTLS